MDRKVRSLALLILHSVVALRKESVDRKKLLGTPDTWTEPVALRKESVDRKDSLRCFYFCQKVALRKESVDRKLL